MDATDLFLFESAFARDTYQRIVGTPKGVVHCVFNGVTPEEFEPVVTADDATDLAYVGEFRHIKGADLLVDAVARLHADGKQVTLTLGGDGEETAALKAQVERLGLADAIRFIGHVKARYGFSKGRLLVVPSRGDSMPYVVIEAARGRHPHDRGARRRHPGNLWPRQPRAVRAQQRRSHGRRDRGRARRPASDRAARESLRERISAHFSQQAMVDGVIAGYRDAFANH